MSGAAGACCEVCMQWNHAGMLTKKKKPLVRSRPPRGMANEAKAAQCRLWRVGNDEVLPAKKKSPHQLFSRNQCSACSTRGAGRAATYLGRWLQKSDNHGVLELARPTLKTKMTKVGQGRGIICFYTAPTRCTHGRLYTFPLGGWLRRRFVGVALTIMTNHGSFYGRYGWYEQKPAKKAPTKQTKFHFLPSYKYTDTPAFMHQH